MSDIHNNMNDIPIYPHTASYAREHNELPQFRESNRVHIACRNAIDKAVSEHFDGMHLNPRAAESVIREFGIERTLLVLANTVQQKSWDGRFSRENKHWAATFHVPEDVSAGFDRRAEYTARSHPAILDGFIAQARKLAQEQQRPTIHDQLRQKPSASIRKPPSQKEPER